MKVEIISKETIKPSSSTPKHLRTHKLCLLDQIAPPQYVPVILFYSPAATNNVNPSKISHHLKQSFSQTLIHFYPLAGRIKDDFFSIDCNDKGASYTEVNVFGEMSMVIQDSNIYQLEKLLPCDPFEIQPEISSQVLLKAQVNYFECGGIAISVCLWHVIGDAATAATFIKTWAAIGNNGSGSCNDIGDLVFDCTTLFPPQDMKSLMWRNLVPGELLSNVLMKRFVFDGSKVAALKEEVGNGPNLENPTRVEAAAALIWKAIMAATGKEYVAAMAVDLRKRIDPPLPNNCIGNIIQATFAVACSFKDYNGLASKLRESIKMINNEYVRKTHAGGGYLEYMREIANVHITDNHEWLNLLGFTSWCRFPFYEADFGWGKPIWVTPALINRCAFLLDTKDGLGIEAWIGLPKELMTKFEQNPGICAYASFNNPINR